MAATERPARAGSASPVRLREQLRAAEASIGWTAGTLRALGIAAIDAALGGGSSRGALHEIAAAREADIAATTAFSAGGAELRRSCSEALPPRMKLRRSRVVVATAFGVGSLCVSTF